MGKLLALEVNNFKSYKGHHVLHFGDSYFTSIIGPNGSGKSNSMDAISFVLGIKSAHLRSTHLKDLIYRGRVLKHSKINADGTATDAGIVNGDGQTNGDAEAGASDGEMEVETEPGAQRNDPQTAWVMAIYEDDAGEEQRWKRSISSSGASEYRINNRVVSAKQYNEALEAENILIRARNFLVFQGDIESIAQQNPTDITRLIEQISGSLEYKAEYDRLKAEKESADKEQQHRLQQRRGINGEIRNFQTQKEELEKYERTRDEKDEAIVTHVLWKLFHFQRTIEDSTAEIQKHQEELKEFRRNVKKFEDKLDEAKRENAKVGRDVSKIEREIKRKEKASEEKENSLLPVDEKLAISNKNLATYQKQIAERTAEKDSQQATAKKLQKDLDTVQKAQQRWDDDWRAQQQQAGRELSEADLQEYQRLRGEVYKRSGNDQNKVDNITRQLKTDEETVNSLKSKLDSTQSQVSALETETAGLSERREDLRRTASSTQKEIDTKKTAINKLTSERTRHRQKHTEADEKLRQVLLKLDEATTFQRESHKEAAQREMVAQMKRIFPGVKGMVHQLCKPKQKKYETAVATALGRHWDSVIVDSEKTAKECMQYLKEQRAGLMTFLPLDTIIHSTGHTANLRGMMQQGMRLAIDTIDYDTSYERAMSCACGNAIVTDTLKLARYLCYDKKVDAKAVVLDGTIIHKGGNMTGGEGVGEKKRRFEETEVENLRLLANKFRAEIEALPRGHESVTEEERLSSELNGLEAKIKFVQDEIKAVEKNLDSKNRELEFAKGQLKDVRPKYEEHARGVEGLRSELEQFTATIEEVEDEVFAPFCQRLGYSDIRDYEQQQGSRQEEANQKKVEFTRQISRLQNSLAFETQRVKSTNERIAKIEAQMERDRQNIEQLEAEREELSGELDELNAEIEQLNSQLEEIRTQHEESGRKVTEARSEVQKKSKSVEKTLKAVAELEATVQTANSNRYAALRQCKVENINVPLEADSGSIDKLPVEDAILEEGGDAMDVDGEEGTIRTPQFNSYGINIDFSDFDDDLKEDSSSDCEGQLLETIANLTSDLEKMAPNMRSAERLEATSERLKATEREFNDSRKAAKLATTAFENVKEKRSEIFKRAFDHISEHIAEVYRELTKTKSFPTGGAASLSVEEEDEPYNAGIRYHAMPPLKRFRDMEHLSGGEKTMAALALLFAVHTYAPSPFFVLDEVDAALDNANTAQLAQYVREHAGPGMQFVVISLKTGLFQESETLVGVMRDQGVNSSRVLTLDLRKYQAVA
ncbi:condensin complex component SMC1 [Neohortaea acidophila]|uniref:Structural maintenance of chromosomes protein n=1 Tax=Neohortaea acidophila TaxID=245834 RepID=A0A6A6PXD2_9PEZI|nr:condensin complex component SMC1 [Neohortaea acidophila]KAF2484153.1 condensin complex component SMC1 [Neohortaea acidophila]